MKKYKNKNMISKALFRNTLVLFLFVQLLFSFSSCDNLMNKNDEGPSFIKIQVSSTTAYRTALPSFSIDSISDFQFTIEGKKDGETSFSPLKTETNTTGTYYSLSNLEAAAFPVEAGDWTFKLTASKDGTLLTSQIDKTISAGSNSLEFNLVWEDDNLSGTGVLSFTLDFSAAPTKSEVAKVTGQLYSELSGTDYEEKPLSNNAGVVTYSLTGLPAGNYRIKIRLYDDKENLILPWSEQAIISGGQQSSKTREIKALNPVYTIDFTFNCSDYSLASGITLPEQYTRFTYDSDWPLPTADQLSRTGYTFEGWYDNADFSGDAVTAIPAGSIGDLHFYAKWTEGTANYQVHHWQQNIDDDEYTEVSGDTQTLQGTTGENTQASAKTYTGFTAKTFSQEPVNADGSTVVNIYYDRNVHTVTYADGLDKVNKYGTSISVSSTDIPATQTYRYGKTVEVAINAKPTLAGYTFSGWINDSGKTYTPETEDISFEIKSDVNFIALWTPANADYKVIHKKQKLSPLTDYEVAETDDSLSGTTGTKTAAEANDYIGFTAPSTITQETIKPDGTTEIIILYDRKSYTVTYDDGVDGETIEVPASTTVLFEETLNIDFNIASRTGYTFNGWKYKNNLYKSGEITSFIAGDENIVLIAQWQVENQDTGIHVDFGVDTSTVEVTQSGSTFTATTGYTSYSWNVDGDAAATTYLNSTSPNILNLSSITVPGVYDITLTATKTVNGSTVTHTWTGQYIKS